MRDAHARELRERKKSIGDRWNGRQSCIHNELIRMDERIPVRRVSGVPPSRQPPTCQPPPNVPIPAVTPARSHSFLSSLF
jgi:hypothetical protein